MRYTAGTQEKTPTSKKPFGDYVNWRLSLESITIRHVITEQLLEIRMKSRHTGLDDRSQDGIMTQKGSGLDWIRKCFGEKLMFSRPVLCHGDDEGDRVADVAAARQADSSFF